MVKEVSNKDWTGNKRTTFVTLGASNHVKEERAEHDYYATDPIAAQLLLENVDVAHKIWECACGEGHLSKVFEHYGHKVVSTDLVDRGYGQCADFLAQEGRWEGDIVTNPPYKYAQSFIEKSLELIEDGNKVCMFLKLQFLEGKARKEFFAKHPPKEVLVSSSRIMCAKNGDFEGVKGSSAVAYAWFVWEKGFAGHSIIKWIN